MNDKNNLLNRTANPFLFSDSEVALKQHDFSQMQNIIKTIQEIVHTPSYMKMMLTQVPKMNWPVDMEIGPRGVFMGYDFHLTPSGPKLIEVNTNAGGALLNFARQEHDHFMQAQEMIYQMFLQEWRSLHPSKDLKVMAIIDDDPEKQFLYSEFQLMAELHAKFGIKVIITDPSALRLKNNQISYDNLVIDLIYNRLTDFYFEQAHHFILRHAFEHQMTMITPNPWHHAMMAHKLNLVFLTDPGFLESMNISEEKIAVLRNGIPKTFLVTQDNAVNLWRDRKNFFFKPVAGYGSKGVYRGDKLTHRVWEEILQTTYLAQEFCPPATQNVFLNNQSLMLKFDVRAYVYQQEIQLLVARLYAGQATNFKTLGGGFAPVRLM